MTRNRRRVATIAVSSGPLPTRDLGPVRGDRRLHRARPRFGHERRVADVGHELPRGVAPAEVVALGDVRGEPAGTVLRSPVWTLGPRAPGRLPLRFVAPRDDRSVDRDAAARPVLTLAAVHHGPGAQPPAGPPHEAHTIGLAGLEHPGPEVLPRPPQLDDPVGNVVSVEEVDGLGRPDGDEVGDEPAVGDLHALRPEGVSGIDVSSARRPGSVVAIASRGDRGQRHREDVQEPASQDVPPLPGAPLIPPEGCQRSYSGS
jgi:hypothetical protein